MYVHMRRQGKELSVGVVVLVGVNSQSHMYVHMHHQGKELSVGVVVLVGVNSQSLTHVRSHATPGQRAKLG